MKSYWYRWYLGRKDISLCIQGQINLFPLNVCRDDHVHYTCCSPMVAHILFTRNHMPFSRCALPSHFPLLGTYNSIILKCPAQLWALPDTHLSFKCQCQCYLLCQVSWFLCVEFDLMSPHYHSTVQIYFMIFKTLFSIICLLFNFDIIKHSQELER